MKTISKEPLVVHLHFCGPYTMALYLGMLVVSYKLPVIAVSSYDRQTHDAITVTVGGETDEAAEAAVVPPGDSKSW